MHPRALAPPLLVIALAGCGGSGDLSAASASTSSTNTVTPTSSSTSTPSTSDEPAPSTSTSEAAQSTAFVKKWAKENALSTESWWRLIKGYQLIPGGGLFVLTRLHPDSDASPIAARICGAYSTIRMDHPEITTIYVRASDGQRLAKCGPGL